MTRARHEPGDGGTQHATEAGVAGLSACVGPVAAEAAEREPGLRAELAGRPGSKAEHGHVGLRDQI
jgi:hypothetical protein